jgi:hypothetical protein
LYLDTGYNDVVDIAAILKELDAEIEKLKRVRKIIAGLGNPVRSGKKKPSRKPLSSPVTAAAEPLLIRLPPKLKREYRPRVKSPAQAPIALATALSDRPVFVPRAALSPRISQSRKSTDDKPELLEATFRKNLLSEAV